MMNESSQRMLDETQKPDEAAMSNWIGSENYELWKQILKFIFKRNTPQLAVDGMKSICIQLRDGSVN
jgi:hypothetical protein